MTVMSSLVYIWLLILVVGGSQAQHDVERYDKLHLASTADIIYDAHPGDCGLYYETRVMRCPNNGHWNRRTQLCDLPQLAGCEAVIFQPYTPAYIPPYTPAYIPPYTPAYIPPQTPEYAPLPEYPASIDPVLLCREGVNPYIPYPGDCHKFIHCAPTPTVLYCPNDLYWDRITNSCKPAINVKC